jgi:hypothetical protein
VGLPITINVLANDLAVNGSSLNASSVTITVAPSAGGSATVNSDGSISYTPATHYYGQDVFTYRVCDTQQPTPLCATALVTVTVVPEPPTANDDYRNDTYVGTIDISVLSNDVAGPAGLVTLTISTAPTAAQGTATVTASNTISFTAAANFDGSASFSYEICDASVPTPLCSDATVTVYVSGIPPIAVNDVAQVNEDGWNGTASVGLPITINVLANDGHPGAALNASAVTITVTPSAGGTATVNPDGTINYTPATHYYGQDVFTYQVCDVETPTPLCATAIVNVTVVPEPPVAQADSAQTTSRGTVVVSVLSNDIAGPAGLHTLTVSTPPAAAQGTASVTASNTISITAAAN